MIDLVGDLREAGEMAIMRLSLWAAYARSYKERPDFLLQQILMVPTPICGEPISVPAWCI